MTQDDLESLAVGDKVRFTPDTQTVYIVQDAKKEGHPVRAIDPATGRERFLHDFNVWDVVEG